MNQWISCKYNFTPLIHLHKLIREYGHMRNLYKSKTIIITTKTSITFTIKFFRFIIDIFFTTILQPPCKAAFTLEQRHAVKPNATKRKPMKQLFLGHKTVILKTKYSTSTVNCDESYLQRDRKWIFVSIYVQEKWTMLHFLEPQKKISMWEDHV